MSRKGPCYDTAVAESFFSTLNNELVHRQTYHTREDASREIFAFLEGVYNRQRLQQSLGYLSPLEFERRLSGSYRGVHKTRASSSRPLFSFTSQHQLLRGCIAAPRGLW